LSFELEFNAVQTGLENVGKVVALTEQQVQRTKELATAQEQLNQRQAAMVNPMQRAHQASEDYAKSEAKSEQDRERYRAQQKRAFEVEELGWRKIQAAQEQALKINAQHDQSNQQLGASIKNFIQNPLQAAGNAAESFALQYGAIGVAAVGVGAGLALAGGWLLKNANQTAAYAQEISRLASRTGMTTTETQLYGRAAEMAGVNAGTLTTAMRTLSRGMSENSDEGKKQKQVLAELGMGADAAFKPMGELLPALFQKLAAVGDVMERDRMTITLFGRSGLEMEPLFAHFQELEARAKASGVVMTEEAIGKAEKYKEELVLLGFQWDALKQKLAIPAIGVIEFIIGKTAEKSQARKGLEGIGAGAGVIGGGAEAFDQIRDLWERFGTAAPAPGAPKLPGAIAPEQALRDANSQKLRAYNMAGEDPKTRMQADLKELQATRESTEAHYLAADTDAKRASGLKDLQQLDAKIKLLKEQEKAIGQLSAAQKREIELTRRSQELYNASFAAGEDSPQKKYDQSRVKIASERADELRKPQANAGKVNASYDLQERAAFVTYVGESAKQYAAELDKLEKRSLTIGDKIAKEAGKEWENVYKNADKAAETIAKDFVKTAKDVRASALKVDEDSLKNLRDMGRKQLGQVGVRNRLAGESEGTDVADAYSLRINQAALEYQAELKIAALRETEKDKQAARDIADADLKQKVFDAQVERENALLNLALKQKEAFESFAVGLFNAAKSGGVGGFLKGQVNKIEDTIVGNVAGMVWPEIQKATRGLRSKAGTTLGKVLTGTPLGPDPAKAGMTDNTLKVADNTQKTSDNTAALNNLTDLLKQVQDWATSPSGGGGSASGILGGFNTFAGLAGMNGVWLNPSSGTTGGETIGGGDSTAGLSQNSSGLWQRGPAGMAGDGSSTGSGETGSAGDGSSTGSGETGSAGDGSSTGSGETGSAGGGETWGLPTDGQQSGGDSGEGTSGSGLTLGKGIGIAGAAAGGILGAYQGFSRGGAKGTMSALGSLASAGGAIAMMAGLAGPAAPIVAGAGMGLSMLSSLLTAGPQQRETDIQNKLKTSQFFAPTPLNVSMGANGGYSDYSMNGDVRGSNLGPYPQVQEPYADYQHNTMVPGGVTSQFGPPMVQQPYPSTPSNPMSPGAGGNVTFNVSAIDSKGVNDFLSQHGVAISQTIANDFSGNQVVLNSMRKASVV
jgi:hypothetical protein